MLQSLQAHAIPSWLSHQGPDCDVVVSTTIALSRNCAHRPFPSHATPHERAMVFDEVTGALGHPGLGDSFNVINSCQLDERELLFLIEERLATRALEKCRDGQGVVHDRPRRIGVTVNGEDHVRIQAMDSGNCARELWTELDALDDAIGMHIEYAFDNRRGFLACRPSDAGTGLSVSFCAHLPALSIAGSIGEVLDDLRLRQGMSVGGFFCRPLPAVGSMVELSRSAGTGSSESRFCEDMAVAMRGIVEGERKARERLLSDERALLTEKIELAFSSLLRAPSLTVEEFCDMTSALRLGIECTLFDKCTIVDLNRLTLFVLPAHLQTFLNRDVDEGEIPRARAALVQSFFAPKTER